RRWRRRRHQDGLQRHHGDEHRHDGRHEHQRDGRHDDPDPAVDLDHGDDHRKLAMIAGPGRVLVAGAMALLPVAGPGSPRKRGTLAPGRVGGWPGGRALLVIVEDAVAPDEPYAWVRA